MSIQFYCKKAIALSVAFLCVYLGIHVNTSKSSEQDSGISANVYFALGDQHEFPLAEERKHFACSDKIFTVIELTNLPKTKYDLAIVWKDPSGAERERTEYPFTVTLKDTRLWSWLSLSPSKGAAMIQWINPAAGLEEFVGPWNVEIFINHKKISTKSFEVIC